MASGEQYVVEKIVNKRIRRGVVQYLIKWTGCDEAQNTWEPEQNLKCDALLQQFHQEKAAETKKRGQKRSTKSLPSDGEQQGTGGNDGAAVLKVEKQDDAEPKTTKRAKNQARRKVGKNAPERTQGQPDGDHKSEAVVKVEIKQECGELLLASDQDKAVQPKKRERASKKSLPLEGEEAIDKERTVVKIEKREDEVQAVKEPMRKRVKRSLDTSQQEQPDEGSVLVEQIEKKDMPRKRQVKPKRELTKEPAVPNETDGQGLSGFARGFIAESLIGITQEGNTFMFLVKWQDMDEMEMVPSAEVRKFAPEMMIDFYESRIIWRKKDQSDK